MRLFGGKDYYDGMQGTGFEHLTYVRQTDRALPLPTVAPLFGVFLHNDRPNVQLIPHALRPIRQKGLPSIQADLYPFGVLVGTRVFWGAVLFEPAFEATPGTIKIFYDLPSLRAALRSKSIGTRVLSGRFGPELRMGEYALSKHGQDVAQDYQIASAILCYGLPSNPGQPASMTPLAPIPFLGRGAFDPTTPSPVRINAPFLKAFRLIDRLDPMQAYQEIEMAIRSFVNPESRMAVLTDQERLDKHGMNHQSFRHPIR